MANPSGGQPDRSRMMGATGGLTLRVAIVGEKVELISADVWIS
jgi:hypothetical protein